MTVDAIPMTGAPPAPRETAPFAEALMGGEGEETLQGSARRLLTGAGLGALFGAAIGLRAGGVAMMTHAVGISFGMLSVALFAVPSLSIVMSLANAPIDARALGGATARATAKGGAVLGGLAPAAALYVMTVEDAITVTAVGVGSLLLAGAIAGRSFMRDIQAPLRGASASTKLAMGMAIPAFLVFASALALRVFWCLLPILREPR